MDVADEGGGAVDIPIPPARLFERLAQLSDYTWDQSVPPFHSSYDNWHVFGIKHTPNDPSSNPPKSEQSRTESSRGSPRTDHRPSIRSYDTGTSDAVSDISGAKNEIEGAYQPIVGRISTHVLRIEREYQLCKSLIQTSDPACNHTVRPLDLVRLPSLPGDNGSIVVSIFESPGRNYLKDLVDFGPAWLDARYREVWQRPEQAKQSTEMKENISLSTFLDFAIGASECLELLHHGLRVVHGEIRADAFHFNQASGVVKLINYGSGPRSFENGLTSSGWSSLSRQIGIKTKLQFIAPEQTGRMPAEPDSRTDIYSLGVLFWSMLTQEPAFDGDTPLDVIQNVLGRRIPPLTSKRMDVPTVVSDIIQKMTRKQIDERYHSTSGLKHDLTEVQRILSDGDIEALKTFEIGTQDVSSFFMLPSAMFGREKEHQDIIAVIEKVSKRQQSVAITSGHSSLYSFSSTSSASDIHLETVEPADVSSDTSSQGAEEPRVNSLTETVPTRLGEASSLHKSSRESTETVVKAGKPPLEPAESGNSVKTSRSGIMQEGKVNSGSMGGSGRSMPGDADVASRGRGSQRFRRRGRCEVITIVGAAGLGKSSMVQSVQGQIRKLGYFASSKFDQAKQAPFEPVLRVLSSLFRQIFSESDVNTEYHHMVRQSVRSIWPSLSGMLELPERLIYLGWNSQSRMASNHQGLNKAIRAEMRNDNASTHSSASGSSSAQVTAHFLRSNTQNQSLRFLSTFMEVLRVLTRGKLICICLDDLQFADEESLELVSNIISGKLRIVLILTYRAEEVLPKKMNTILESGDANTTRLRLSPLSEAEVVRYVSSTLYRPEDYAFPLAAVCLEKTNGNPFYLRQMLELCHQKNCLWYSWKHSMWEFDLDRVFAEFESESYGQQLNSNFITERLQEQLEPAARSILAWGSLLGSTFSFSLVQRLLSGEFDTQKDREQSAPTCLKRTDIFSPQPAERSIEGLQSCLQAYILVPGEDEDSFRFSHDRYIQAAASLRECHDVESMHFVIAMTMMKYIPANDSTLYTRARHICQAVDLIVRKIKHRRAFRDLLCEAARKATASGARPTALWYYENTVKLLQASPWADGTPDVDYKETLDLYCKAAELYWFQERSSDALQLLSSTFANGRTASDKAPSWILQSRLLAQRGDTLGAFNALRNCLNALGLHFEHHTSWEACDMALEALIKKLQILSMEEVVQKQLSEDSAIIAMGPVLVEAMSAAFWSDALLFYQMTIQLISVHVERGAFLQIGLGFPYLAMVIMSRKADFAFGVQMDSAGHQLLRRFNDPYTTGRGLAVSCLFVSHLTSPIQSHLVELEEAVDMSLAAGDRHVFLTAIGALAMCRLSLGLDLADLESFCAYAAEDFGNWQSDLRGGVILTGVRQVARALQGKTFNGSASTVMSDELHDSEKYLANMRARASNVHRPKDLYTSMAMIPLYLFGYWDHAIETGTQMLLTADDLWTFRHNRLNLFYLSLAHIARVREARARGVGSDDERDEVLAKVQEYKSKIELWQAQCDVNYMMWSTLIEAESSEISGNFHDAIQAYEMTIDHAQVHGFALEEALAFELQGEFYIRRGAKRAARNALEDAIGAYSRISAVAKAEMLTVRHEWVLKNATRSRTVDAGVQTAKSVGEIGNTQYRIEENERQQRDALGKESAGDRTKAWLSPNAHSEQTNQNASADVSELGLDVLDLQSILEFNQAISSELQIDILLGKMTEIILESAGAQADFAGVVVEGEDGEWTIAAHGTQDGIRSDVLLLKEIQDETAKQVTLYTLRFKEPVFVQNVLLDERFSANAPSAKSVISLPILRGGHLLGNLYLEGKANSFTSRNLGVLQLFCTQVGISIANALLFRKVRQVSASNTSMIESQKRALASAREAETKAKYAEAEAMRSVRLKEEAAKAKSIFLANTSHELRTPLNGVIGMSELLKGTTLNAEQEGYADSIRVCADTLLTVINDILDFSKLEAGKMKLFSVPLNLRETITEVVRALTYTNLERGLETVEELSLDPKLLVMGDPVRLHQIFMNLLSNAYKFTEKGSVTIKTKTELENKDKIIVTFSVKDTGIGITQEQLSRLFKPFSQADSSTQRSYGGSGLGLSICKALIGVLDGKIWLESQIGLGTTVSFTLRFPKARGDALSTSAQVSSRDPGTAIWSSEAEIPRSTGPDAVHIDLSQIPRDEVRICIAEDNPINQKIAVSFVTKLGFKSEAFNDGKQAVDALRQRSKESKPFHLVLMDVQMPVLDGYDATRAIRKDEDPAVRQVLVIAMTASAIRGDREKCLEAGMNNYLAKPVRAAVLKAMLEDYLNQPRKLMPNLQETAKNLAQTAMEQTHNEPENSSTVTDSPTVVRPDYPPRKSSLLINPGLPIHANGNPKEESNLSPKTPTQPKARERTSHSDQNDPVPVDTDKANISAPPTNQSDKPIPP